MTKIQINTQQVRYTARQLLSDAARLFDLSQELEHAIGSLDTWAWDGRSRARAAPLLNRVRPESAHAAERLGELGRKLMRVADVFEQEDNTAARNLDEMLWVDFAATGSSSKHPKLDNMQDLYKQVKEVDDNTPIKIIRIGDGEYLILLEGTQMGQGGHNWGSAIQAGLGMSSTYERQVREYIEKHVPKGAEIHFAGHSQGGIVANSIADNQGFIDRYGITSVTTFGSPTNAHQNQDQGIDYYTYAAEGDIVPMLDRDVLSLQSLGIFSMLGAGYLSSKSQTNVSGGNFKNSDGNFDPFAPHGYYSNAPELLGEKVPFGEITEWHEVGSYKVEALDGMSYAWQNLESDNWFNKASGGIDLVFESGKNLTLASVDVGIETISGAFPEPIRDGIDRYTDYAYDYIAELPTPTQFVGGVIDVAQDTTSAVIDLGGEAIDKTGEFFSNVFSF